jgi:hypothetical protein
MKRLGSRAGDDELEKKVITDIAAAHGGHADDGGKDTISHLIPEPTIRLLSEDVRVQFLAALLRFADEIADDRGRASRFALAAGAIPPKSRIYHQYSQSLHSVTVGEREITLDFDLSEAVAEDRFEKKIAALYCETYLLDEIFERSLKMHLERMYCMRFLRPWIRLDEVRVNIEVYEVRDGRYGRRLEQIRYRLSEIGYPERPGGGIRDLCPELKDWTGAILSAKLKRAAEVAPCQL